MAGQAAEVYRDIATPPEFTESIYGASPRFKTWTRIKDLLSRLDPANPRAHLRANALAAAFSRKQLVDPSDAETAFEAFASTETQLGVA